MQSIAEALRTYMHNHPFDTGSSDAETVLDQIYQACKFRCVSHTCTDF